MQHSASRAARFARDIDPWLMLSILGLVCFGVLMVYSASIADAYTYYGSPYYVVQRQVVWAGLGLVALGVSTRIHYRQWERVALPFFVVSLLMLVMVLVPHVGHISHGARRWFAVGASISLQPSELIKVALVIYMAAWLPSKGEAVRDFQKCFVPFSLMVGIVALLIEREPDLGTALVVAMTMLAVFYVAGANLTHMPLVAAPAVGFAWVLAHGSSYRYDRLTAFLNPWKDPTGTGFHTVQALLALGRGGLFGQGLGNSIQKNVLPAPHTDSILAVIGEEFGLLGTASVLTLFMIITYRGMRISMGAPDPFGRLLAAGITSWIAFQALMNFAVITSSVPFTGVPLPFISYGGTSLIITMFAVGILLNISRHASGEVLARERSDHGRGNRRSRVPRVIDHPVPTRRTKAEPAGARADGTKRRRRPRSVPAGIQRARDRTATPGVQ